MAPAGKQAMQVAAVLQAGRSLLLQMLKLLAGALSRPSSTDCRAGNPPGVDPLGANNALISQPNFTAERVQQTMLISV